VLDGKIYIFGGDVFDGASLVAQTKTEVLDPAAGTWDDAAVAELPSASGEGRAYGFGTASGYELAGKIVIAGGGVWPSAWNEVEAYDVATDSYDYAFPNLTTARRDHAGFFVPGNPGALWVFGGWAGSDSAPFGPPEYFQVEQTGPGEPDISVEPASLSAELCPDSQDTQTLRICNVGTEPLYWSLSEVPAERTWSGSMQFVPVKATRGAAGNPGISASAQTGFQVAPEAPANPAAVLWDQPPSSVNQNAYIDQEFPDYPEYSSFLADDFVNADTWKIGDIFIPGNGWNGFSSLLNADSLTWQIYADDGGMPDGDPSGGGNPPLWTLTLAPTDPQVTISTGRGGMPSDTTLDLAVPMLVPAGHWWLVFYPTMFFGTGGQFGREPSDTTNFYVGQFINPGGGFGYGTAWQAWTVIGPTQQDIAFRLEGPVCCGPGIPWLSEDPTTGTALPGECADVAVTFDSAGLAPGDYSGSLVADSNDPDEPMVEVPVQLTVVACGNNELHINRTKIFRHPSAPMVVKVVTQFEILDQNGNPVPGATMAGEWTLPDASVVPGVPFYGLTDAKGHEKFRLMAAQLGTYMFCVTGITAPGFVPWDPGDPLACTSIEVFP
jgi:hypothetical protein